MRKELNTFGERMIKDIVEKQLDEAEEAQLRKQEEAEQQRLILAQQAALQAKAAVQAQQQKQKVWDRTESQAQEEMLKEFFVEEEKLE